MALTDHSDVMLRLHEDGINRLILHVMRQSPALFRHGTAAFVTLPETLWGYFPPHPEVERQGNPILTVWPPLPIPLSENKGLDFCLHVTGIRVDFHPSPGGGLPPGSDLAPQTFALRVTACAAMGCPPPRSVRAHEASAELLGAERLLERVAGGLLRDERIGSGSAVRQAIPGTLLSFELGATAVAGVHRTRVRGREALALRLHTLELTDLAPLGLENAIECYVATMVRIGIFPRLQVALDTLLLELTDTLALVPAPTIAELPDNPALSDDAISVYVDVV